MRVLEAESVVAIRDRDSFLMNLLADQKNCHVTGRLTNPLAGADIPNTSVGLLSGLVAVTFTYWSTLVHGNLDGLVFIQDVSVNLAAEFRNELHEAEMRRRGRSPRR